MTVVVLWCGFVGAWLLVAGPVFQAAVELHAQTGQREVIDRAARGVPRPARVSRWWWLLPPVKYLLERRAGQEYQDRLVAALGPEELQGVVDYMVKARGWLLVGAGGSFLAAKETWELVEHYEGPVWVWVLVVVVMLAVSAANAAVSVGRSEDVKGRRRSAPAAPRA